MKVDPTAAPASPALLDPAGPGRRRPTPARRSSRWPSRARTDRSTVVLDRDRRRRGPRRVRRPLHARGARLDRTRTPRSPARAMRLHGELMAGPWGDHVIELGACWAIVMALTGYVLFVRGWRARRRARASGRPGAKLRSRHALVGAVVGVGLLYLLVSGLPWTGFWGEKVQTFATERGSSMWSTDPGALSRPDLDARRVAAAQPPDRTCRGRWATPRCPTSDPADARRRAASPTSTPRSYVAEREGLRHPMTVALPGRRRDGVFSVIGYAFDAPSDERTRARRPVRRRGRVDVRLRRLPAAGQGRLAGHRAARGPQPRAVVVLGLGADVPRGDLHVRHRAADVVAPPARRARPRWALPAAGCRCGPPRRSSSALVALGVFLPLFGISLLVVLAARPARAAPGPGAGPLVRHHLTTSLTLLGEDHDQAPRDGSPSSPPLGVLALSASPGPPRRTSPSRRPRPRPGAYTVLTVSVPHGCDGSPTTKIAVQLPESIVRRHPHPQPAVRRGEGDRAARRADHRLARRGDHRARRPRSSTPRGRRCPTASATRSSCRCRSPRTRPARRWRSRPSRPASRARRPGPRSRPRASPRTTSSSPAPAFEVTEAGAADAPACRDDRHGRRGSRHRPSRLGRPRTTRQHPRHPRPRRRPARPGPRRPRPARTRGSRVRRLLLLARPRRRPGLADRGAGVGARQPVSSDPEDGAVVATLPDQLVLTFNEPVRVEADAATGFRADGSDWELDGRGPGQPGRAHPGHRPRRRAPWSSPGR